MLFADPWHWMEPDGSLPRDHPQLWPRLVQLAQAIEAGWDLPPGTARQTLMLCSKRPARKRCPGLLWVSKTSDERLLVSCRECRSEQILIQNWQKTPWARPRPAPQSFAPPPPAVDLEELVEGFQLPEDWQAYLDLATGQVHVLPLETFRQLEGEPPSLFDEEPELTADFLEEARVIHTDRTGRYAALEPPDSHESHRLMESFVGGLSEGRLRQQLEQALRGARPRSQFQDLLIREPTVREFWLAYERKALLEHARSWLEDVQAEYQPATSRR